MIERYGSGGRREETYGHSRVVVAGPSVHVAGTTATLDGVVQHVGDAFGQTVSAFRAALDALAKTGAYRPGVAGPAGLGLPS